MDAASCISRDDACWSEVRVSVWRRMRELRGKVRESVGKYFCWWRKIDGGFLIKESKESEGREKRKERS